MYQQFIRQLSGSDEEATVLADMYVFFKTTLVAWTLFPELEKEQYALFGEVTTCLAFLTDNLLGYFSRVFVDDVNSPLYDLCEGRRFFINLWDTVEEADSCLGARLLHLLHYGSVDPDSIEYDRERQVLSPAGVFDRFPWHVTLAFLVKGEFLEVLRDEINMLVDGMSEMAPEILDASGQPIICVEEELVPRTRVRGLFRTVLGCHLNAVFSLYRIFRASLCIDRAVADPGSVAAVELRHFLLFR